jgi:glycosyltransferase involved in cell wall biosynthesis
MKLSIITVNLNNKAGLEKTIRSVAEQTFADFEYIIIDGGSTDGSADVIKKYANKIKDWVSEKDNGIYNAMNKGILKSSGEYLLFLNSGDYLLGKDILEKVFALNRTEDILYGNMMIDYGFGNLAKGIMPGQINFKHMMRDTLWHPVSFIRKELLLSLGMYDESLKITADYDFFLKAILVNKCSLYHLQETISVFSFDGISSLPANREIIQTERNSIQLRYFNQKQINDAIHRSISERIIEKLRQLICTRLTMPKRAK